MKTDEFDAKFDAGEDVSDAIDWAQARRPSDKPMRVTRQSLIKLWIAERLE
jgi:hypothetical protein